MLLHKKEIEAALGRQITKTEEIECDSLEDWNYDIEDCVDMLKKRQEAFEYDSKYEFYNADGTRFEHKE